MSSRILIVEDNTSTRRTFSKALQEDGFDTFEAPDGETAIGMVRRHKPHVIIIEMSLPGISGIDTAQVLRLMPVTAKTPVVMLTDVQFTPGERNEAQAHVAAVMRKPIAPQALVKQIEEIVKKGKR